MKTCGANMMKLTSYRSPDRIVHGEIVPGVETALWQTCGKKPGHRGEHGPWSRWRRYRFIIEAKLRGRR